MRSVKVRLRSPYNVFVGDGILSKAGPFVQGAGINQSRVLVVSQKPVAAIYLDTLLASLNACGYQSQHYVVPFTKDSEQAKSEKGFLKLIKEIAACDGRGTSIFLIALGGGVIGDLAGFAASVYRRGTPYVQIPTTLIAQVDSAIGGKTAIDLPEGKNLLGTVYQPRLVISDSRCLSTLSEKNWSDGFAEIIKYGIIKDPSILSLLEGQTSQSIRSNHRLLSEIILKCVKIKAEIVEKDEFDKLDLRIILNFGHTAGHAIETASKFSSRYSHGQAVALGMLVACEIAQELGVLKEPSLKQRLETALLKFHLSIYYQGLDEKAILRSMSHDKKRTHAYKNRFVLPVRAGKTVLVPDVPDAVILRALKKRKK